MDHFVGLAFRRFLGVQTGCVVAALLVQTACHGSDRLRVDRHVVGVVDRRVSDVSAEYHQIAVVWAVDRLQIGAEQAVHRRQQEVSTVEFGVDFEQDIGSSHWIDTIQRFLVDYLSGDAVFDVTGCLDYLVGLCVAAQDNNYQRELVTGAVELLDNLVQFVLNIPWLRVRPRRGD